MYRTQAEDNPLMGLPLAFGLLLSAIAHIFIFITFVRVPHFEAGQPIVTDVTFEPLRKMETSKEQQPAPPLPPIEKRTQMVSSPDNDADRGIDVKPKHLFESDKDARTDKEQVRRGDDKAAGIPGPAGPPAVKEQQRPGPKTQQQPKPQQPQPQEQARQQQPPPQSSAGERPLQQLKLDDSEVFQKFAMNQERQGTLNERLNTEQTEKGLANYEPFSRPMGSGAKLLGRSGINDYLPDLPDGDITLLNAKANKFATFVNRIATQVFSQMRASGLESMNVSEITKVGGFCTVRAQLSTKGQLLNVTVEDSSGSRRFDGILESSTRAGARDPNPPPEAVASDGTIHFVFQSKMWAQAASGRSGMPFTRVWLLLATGLE